MQKGCPWYRQQDWMINWLGFTILSLSILLIYFDIKDPVFKKWQKSPHEAWADSGTLGIPVLYLLMCLGFSVVQKYSNSAQLNPFDLAHFLVGFTVVFIISLISKWIAAQQDIKVAKIGDSIWAIFLGCLCFQIVKRFSKKGEQMLESAKLTEPYIAASLVLLVVDFSQFSAVIGQSFLVAWIDTPLLFLAFSYFGYKVLGLRPKQSMILTGCTVICGSSAATAIRNSVKGIEKDQKDAIIISSLLSVPTIVLLPYIAKSYNFSNEVAGSWFGGCVDSTGAVLATASMFSTQSTISAAVVKMIQNILIAPFSVLVVSFYVKYQKYLDFVETGEQSIQQQQKIHYAHLIWDRFPKFVLGFVISISVFNVCITNNRKNVGQQFIFSISEWFSTCSFVSIGFGLRTGQYKGKQILVLVGFYLLIQTVDVLVTLGMAQGAYAEF